jgi:signal transduction histidine kinase
MSHTEFISEDFEILSELDKQELIGDLNLSAKGLYLLLENLLQWSKSQTGDINISPQKFYIKELFENIESLYKIQLQTKLIKIENNIDEKIQVSADINMLSTVVRNLLLNAIKFSYPESLIILKSCIQDKSVRIEVTDIGTGIDDDRLRNIFKLEHTQSIPGTNDEKGSGLGLILCKEFIELNGGKIWIESKIGVGSSFFFTIPLLN